MTDCKTCSKPILPPSPICSYENNNYHPECLTCVTCKLTLSGKKFIKEKNGSLICEECNRINGPKCSKCQVTFLPGQSYKKLNEEVFYHNECFKCAGPCGKPIGAEFYDIENGNFLCVECYDKYGNDYEKYMNTDTPFDTSRIEPKKDVENLVTNLNNNLNLNNQPPISNNNNNNNNKTNVQVLPAVERERESPKKDDSSDKCATCGQKLVGTFTIYDEKKYHSKCFVCFKCNQEFKEKTFFKLDGKPCCRTCHSKSLVENSIKCSGCTQPILDTIVTFKTAKYHDYCLVCKLCQEKLVGKSIYTDKNDQPYCTDCFTKKEGKVCAKCSKIIAPSQTNLVFENKNFHKECFTCNQCFKQINSSESFYKTGEDFDSIICASCA